MTDLRPLRESTAFRRFWAGSALSAIGSQMTTLAVALQIFTITRSSVAVGVIGLVTAVPVILFGLIGGTVADAVDRRTLVLVTSSCAAGVSAAFAAQAFAALNNVWLLYSLLAAQALLNAVQGPARQTFLPRLLPAEQVPAGAALTVFTFHLSMTTGPALAGVVAAVGGLKTCYLLDAISFAAALYGIAGLPAMPPLGSAAKPGMRAIGDAMRFIRHSTPLRGAFLSDMNATILGMPFAIFPALNAEHFGGAVQTLGLLTAAPAVGGLLGSALSGPVRHVTHQGRAILIATAVWGASLTGFGLARSFVLAFALLALAGAADVLSVVFRSTIVQVETPDRYRGRVSAAEYVVGFGCPQLGNFRGGALASVTSPAISAVTGGLSTIVGAALIGLAMPDFPRYRAGSPGDRPDVGESDADGTPEGHPAVT